MRRRATSEAWLTWPERAALLGLRLAAAVALLLGHRTTRALAAPLVLFRALLDGEARRASRRWLRRVRGRAGGFRAVQRHLLHVARLRVDDVFLLAGRAEGLEFTHTGREHLARLRGRRQGALLLGAHLGSLAALRVLAREHGRRVHVMAPGLDARLCNALLRRLDPAQDVRLIEAGAGALSGVLQARALVEQGELVALLGDRARADEPAARVEFVGARAAFPTAPFALAAGLGCPLYLVLALQRAPDRYELLLEPLVERVALATGERDAALGELAARFAARLEHHARRAPDDWSNLYDFWAPRPRPARAAAARAGSLD